MRDYTSAALLAGRLPLWNPYLFLGVPLLANSQAGVFYPFNVLLAGLPAPIAINVAILMHLGLAGVGAYLLGRRWLALGRPGAWAAGALYSLGGFLSAQAEHVNQLAVSAWLPWLLLLLAAAVRDERAVESEAKHRARPHVRWRPTALLALLVGVCFLAGHTQAWYISMFALGLAALGVPLGRGWQQRKAGRKSALTATWVALWPRALVLLIAAGWGIALSALQLLPTLELSNLSIRGGGLSYRETIAFSLQPQLVLRALLPGYGESVFSEYVAYAGWVGLALAGLGLWRARRRRVWWGRRRPGLRRSFPGLRRVQSVLLCPVSAHPRLRIVPRPGALAGCCMPWAWPCWPAPAWMPGSSLPQAASLWEVGCADTAGWLWRWPSAVSWRWPRVRRCCGAAGCSGLRG